MIQYRKGYKYVLHEDALFPTGILPGQPLETQFILLHTDGELLIRKGYAWDGATVASDIHFIRASLVHDALYQLIREELLTVEDARLQADKLMRRMCIADGMWKIRAWWVYRAVRFGGENASREGREVLTA